MPTPHSTRVLAVIPARYASKRFPGKALASIAGRPMIERVVTQARRAAQVSRVVVATDDERIAEAVHKFGGEAVLTWEGHRCGTERVAEVASAIAAEIYVNIQADEPLMDPAAVDAVIEAMLGEATPKVATPCVEIRQASELGDPNVVKVVRDFDDNALYFSRAPIPWLRDEAAVLSSRHYKHIGLYAFTREALLEYPTLPPGMLERLEQLEQLRWLENGIPIRVVETSYDAVSVDVPADVARVEQILSSNPEKYK